VAQVFLKRFLSDLASMKEANEAIHHSSPLALQAGDAAPVRMIWAQR
jgi:hypothetical protein